VRDVKFQLEDKTKKLSIIEPAKRLIITSGDTSDVDGFIALAEYSKVSIGRSLASILPIPCRKPNNNQPNP
jgi:hypothetical protein